MISNLEEADEFVLRGWALYKANPAITISLDIFINNQFIARVPAGTFRSDLQAEGFGDGRHAFYFNPFDYLSRPENFIDVRESSSSQQIYGGHRIVKTSLATNRVSFRKSVIRAQARWKNPLAASPGAGEQVFLRRLQLAVHFNPGLRILEIGAGQGHLVGHLIKRKKPFASYLGFDLSRAHVDALVTRYENKNIRFMHADAARYPFSAGFDVVIASSICETMFPSFLPLLKNVSRVLPAGGIFAFDLAVEDDRASISRAEWNGDQYLRLYSQAEIRRQLGLVKMEMMAADIYEKSPGEHRVFVTALKLPASLANRFEF